MTRFALMRLATGALVVYVVALKRFQRARMSLD